MFEIPKSSGNWLDNELIIYVYDLILLIFGKNLFWEVNIFIKKCIFPVENRNQTGNHLTYVIKNLIFTTFTHLISISLIPIFSVGIIRWDYQQLLECIENLGLVPTY